MTPYYMVSMQNRFWLTLFKIKQNLVLLHFILKNIKTIKNKDTFQIKSCSTTNKRPLMAFSDFDTTLYKSKGL